MQQTSDRIAALSEGAPPRGARDVAARESAPAGAGGLSAAATVPRPDLTQLMDLFRKERYAEIAAQLADMRVTDVPTLVLLAVALVNQGKTGEAEEVCRRVLKADELNAEAGYVLALCREHDGDIDGAIKQAQIAGYLDSGFAMPHLLLGRLARRRGERDSARLELRRALELLVREDSLRTQLFGGGFGREALVQLCRSELKAVGG